MDNDWRRPGELPWGWWMRSRGGVLEDEHGRTWASVRDGFWQGELGFPEAHFAPEQHELMLRVLTAVDRGWASAAETKYDMFDGDMMFWRFYMCWLMSIGLLETSQPLGLGVSPLERGLSDYGKSVTMMLQATREPAWEDLPMQDVVDAVAASARGPADDDREDALQAFERAVGLRRHVFARECVGRSHLVTLTSMAGGPGTRMPVRRVVWSTSFKDAAIRDDLFAWLATRVDRWDAWGAMAFDDGANAFGRHLLGLIVARKLPESGS